MPRMTRRSTWTRMSAVFSEAPRRSRAGSNRTPFSLPLLFARVLIPSSEDLQQFKINLKQRINQVQRIGRCVVAAHEDGYLTVWDVNKSTKRPVHSLAASGPIRFFSIYDDAIIAGMNFASQIFSGGY